MSDRIAVMTGGRIVQLASPREVYEEPRTTFVANFVGVSNLLPGEVVGRSGQEATLELDGGWRFGKAFRHPPAPGAKVLVAVRPEKLRVAPPGRGLAGHREDFVYLGSRVTQVVRVAGGHVLQVEDAAGRPGNGASAIGEAVAVEWDEADCLVFDADRGGRIE
jgi:ABC-type Fe3+/spermidine/putrescine transport system ATPase subunit